MTTTAERELVLSRVFDAPREVVYRAWTEPEAISAWYGPNGFRTTVQEMDLRPGGVWRFIMHAPNGVDYPNQAVFHEVVPPERLTFTHSSGAEDDAGFEVTVTFGEEAGKTRLTLRQVYPTVAEREYAAREIHAVEMGNQTLDRLAAHLASQ